jgi:hypothetical protein
LLASADINSDGEELGLPQVGRAFISLYLLVALVVVLPLKGGWGLKLFKLMLVKKESLKLGFIFVVHGLRIFLAICLGLLPGMSSSRFILVSQEISIITERRL